MTGTRPWRLPARCGAAAAVVLCLASAATAAAPRPVVPWLATRPRTASARPPLAPPCRAADLRARLFVQGATGSLVGGVDLRNSGRAACALLGYPRVSFAGTAARAERLQVKRLAASSTPPETLADPPGSLRALAPGKSATAVLYWSNWCGPGATPTGDPGTPPAALVLGLPGGASLSLPLARAPRCDAPQFPSTVSVGRFAPALRHLPASSRLPLRATVAGVRTVPVKPGLRAFRVRRGEPFRYVVALTNTGRTAFRFARSSCPSYIEQVAPGPPRAYVLNCRPISEIAPHATVLFAMRIPIPASAGIGLRSLTWELAPKTYEAPFATAALRITSRAPIAFRWLQMLDRRHGYALGLERSGAYRLLWTADGGQSFVDVTPGGGRIHPDGPVSILGATRLFARTLRPGVFAVVRSDDAGRTWRGSLRFRDPHGLGAGQPFALDSRHLFLAVDEGAAAGSQAQALYVSDDGGHRFRFVSRTDATGRRPHALPFGCDKDGFGFSTPARGFAGGYCPGGPPFHYRTDDGGRTWRLARLRAPARCACETSAPSFFTPRSGALFVSGFAADGSGRPFVRVLWTRDGGDRWTGTDAPVGRSSDVVLVDTGTAWVVGQRAGNLRAPFDLVSRTTDSGVHWRTVRAPFDLRDFRLDALSATVAYGYRIAYGSSTLVRTLDGGRTWQTLHPVMSR